MTCFTQKYIVLGWDERASDQQQQGNKQYYRSSLDEQANLIQISLQIIFTQPKGNKKRMNPSMNTPQYLPLLSPFYGARQNFPSPLMSPYAGFNQIHFRKDHQISADDFENFQLDHTEEPQYKIEQTIQEISEPVKKEEVKEVREIHEESQDESFESHDDCESSQKIKRIINLLVKHSDKNDDKLLAEKSKCVQDDKQMAQIFDILVKKFRKLKKTKQQMTKYCMRKAFKFLAQKYKKVLEGKDTNDFLKEYFEQVQGQSFSIPFKKNSEDKTMNTNFLKKVFSSRIFLADYKQFIKNFQQLVQQDNNKKVKYLSNSIRAYLNGGSIKTIKRLPWTQIILDKTIDLANRLVTHSPDYQAEHTQRQQKFKKVKKESYVSQTSTSTRRKSTVSTHDIEGTLNQD